MKVIDFVKASYMDMRFKSKDGVLIYDFTWEDDIAEDDFLTEYSDYIVKSFKSVTDGIIDVYISK